ncbi:MAG: hypothetical protein IPK72_17655 [Candidatus Eisenbacteria bacterium]|nr:hypothetical protein [Candidatus Eisenbacteria bacterium]
MHPSRPPDRVALCYASDSPDPIQYLWLVTAAADRTSPTWQSSIIQTTYYPIQMASPSLSATEGSPWESARVACVWQADSTGYTDIRSLNYAGSTNGGATWTTDPGSPFFDDYAPMARDVAIDELYRLHVALSLNEEVIFLRAAYDFGYGYVQTSSWQISTPATTVKWWLPRPPMQCSFPRPTAAPIRRASTVASTRRSRFSTSSSPMWKLPP